MNKFILNLVFAAFIISPLVLKAQENKTTNTVKSYYLSIGLLGAPSWPIGLTYGQMLSDRVSFELGLGTSSSGAGFKFYITNPRKHRFNIHSGLYGSVTYEGFPMFYLPLGISYIGKSNFEYSVDVGVLYSDHVSTLENEGNISPWLGFKLGYRFGEDISSFKNTEKTDSRNIISLKTGLLDPWVGVVYERLFSPHLGAEVSIGLLGASAGANVYFPGLRPASVSFKTGIIHGWGYGELKGYVPFGINLMTKNNFMFSIDAGPQYWYENDEVLIGASIKMGKAF